MQRTNLCERVPDYSKFLEELFQQKVCSLLTQDRYLAGKAASPGLRWPHLTPFPSKLRRNLRLSLRLPSTSPPLSVALQREGVMVPLQAFPCLDTPRCPVPSPEAAGSSRALTGAHPQAFPCSLRSLILPSGNVPFSLGLRSDVTSSRNPPSISFPLEQLPLPVSPQ